MGIAVGPVECSDRVACSGRLGSSGPYREWKTASTQERFEIKVFTPKQR